MTEKKEPTHEELQAALQAFADKLAGLTPQLDVLDELRKKRGKLGHFSARGSAKEGLKHVQAAIEGMQPSTVVSRLSDTLARAEGRRRESVVQNILTAMIGNSENHPLQPVLDAINAERSRSTHPTKVYPQPKRLTAVSPPKEKQPPADWKTRTPPRQKPGGQEPEGNISDFPWLP